jgi:hypothetical protein
MDGLVIGLCVALDRCGGGKSGSADGKGLGWYSSPLKGTWVSDVAFLEISTAVVYGNGNGNKYRDWILLIDYFAAAVLSICSIWIPLQVVKE